MQKTVSTSLFLLASVLVASADDGATESVLDRLKPHRAIYDLSLDWASAQSGVEALDGRFVYEFTGNACSGYETDMRMVTDISKEEGTVITDQVTSTLEDALSKSFSFSNVLFSDFELQMTTSGEAVRTAGDEISLMVDDVDSEERALELQAAEFPTEYMAHVIIAARAGKRVYQAMSFDGSGDTVMLAVTMIGKPAFTDGISEQDDLERWPITTAYYPAGEVSGDQIPDYSVSMVLSSGGVSRDLLMDFGDFRISGAMQTLDMLEAPRCSGEG